MRKYTENQLKQLGVVDEDSSIVIKIAVNNPTATPPTFNSTHWLNISADKLQKIQEVLKG